MIYLDNQATTTCDPLVVEAMVPYFHDYFANAASSHDLGLQVADLIEKSRKQMARLISCQPDELIFTSGATESNNIALLGSCRKYVKSNGKRRKLLTTPIEHKAVLGPLQQLESEGWELRFLPIDQYGRVDIVSAKEMITEDVHLVSIQLANSEIGTIQPVREVSELAHELGVLVHCDAAQGIGKIPIDVNDLAVDLLSFSAHKIYGPKGIGALWIRNQFEKAISPIMFGGNPAKGLRPGTAPVPLIIGFGKACEIVDQKIAIDSQHTKNLRDFFEQELLRSIPGLKINGATFQRLNGNSSITFPDVDAEALLANIPEIIASTTSACDSGSIEPSRVLISIGLSSDEAFQTIRFGFGRFNTIQQIDIATKRILGAYNEILNY